jgi:RNA-binding protein 39
VNNVILLRDKFTGAHKGFAYVEMEELEHIPNCLLFNNVVPDFQKFPILVKASEAEKNFIARKDPFSKQYEGLAGPDSRIYLGNIHVSLDETALKAVLEQFGPVESIKLHRDHLGNSKGFAFVKFLRSDSAQVALAALPGLELAGRALKVGHVTETGAGGGGKSNDSGLVGSSFANDSANSANWKLDADEGGGGLQLNAQSRMMLMAKLAQNAGIQMPAAQVLPPSISAIVNNPPKSVPPVSGTPSRFVLITNMFDPATETEPNWDHEIKEDVSDECSNFGPVEYCYVEKSKPGGLVFIRMKTVDGATKASNALNGRYFAGRMITCSFLEEKTFNDMTR